MQAAPAYETIRGDREPDAAPPRRGEAVIIDVPDGQALAILGSMLQVALTHGEEGVSKADTATIDAAATIVLGLSGRPIGALEPYPPDALALALGGDQQDGTQAVRMLAVMSLVDGRIDAQKIALLQAYADALGVHEAYLTVLAESVAGEISAASVCMMRKNAETFPGLNLEGFDVDRIAPFLPYRDGHGDPELVIRYEALSELDADTFGHAFWQHFKHNRFAFPGDPNGLAEAFTTRHDSSHVLSGYSTSTAGELLVSTFIGAMHPDHPMAAEVLPALYSYHLGIAMNDIASVRTQAFEPQSFWTAWNRGAATTTDVFDPTWEFWAATVIPLEQLRRAYNVLPADPALMA
jgi:hypothetical protein